MKKATRALIFTVFMTIGFLLTGCGNAQSNGAAKNGSDTIELLNVSYDPTREFYAAYNELFSAYWKQKSGQEVKIAQSHGGSGSQARSVIEGNEADVVTLALAHDVTAIENAGLIESGWMEDFELDSSPLCVEVSGELPRDSRWIMIMVKDLEEKE